MPKQKSAATRKAKSKKPPYGQVGPQTFEAVRKVVEAKAVPLVKAFEEVAQATGRQATTVAVTYYNALRKMRGGKPARRAMNGAAKRGARTTRASSMSGGVKGIMSQVSSAIASLEAIIAQQAKEIERLKGESQLADRIRKAFHK